MSHINKALCGNNANSRWCAELCATIAIGLALVDSIAAAAGPVEVVNQDRPTERRTALAAAEVQMVPAPGLADDLHVQRLIERFNAERQRYSASAMSGESTRKDVRQKKRMGRARGSRDSLCTPMI